MVTGFNTDVKHDGKVYHVQTEDKGVGNPLIETLIYVGGEILAARRTSYADLLEEKVDEKQIAERIEAQHNRMILDIKEGKYDNKRHRPFGEGIISSKSFDEVVLEYLKLEANENRIILRIDGPDVFIEGETVGVDLEVTRASEGKGVSGAKIKVKLISTVEKPKTLFEGKTDGEGRIRFDVDLPAVDDGTSALIIQARAGKETAELKQLVRKVSRKAAG
ncbi:MAG: hypothetical protein O7A63_02170 [Acidobacteria bacterium]|nr:hypothetical protein [Acidobacteriota bacterium]